MASHGPPEEPRHNYHYHHRPSDYMDSLADLPEVVPLSLRETAPSFPPEIAVAAGPSPPVLLPVGKSELLSSSARGTSPSPEKGAGGGERRWYRKRPRFVVGSIMALLVMVVIALGAVLGVALSKNSSDGRGTGPTATTLAGAPTGSSARPSASPSPTAGYGYPNVQFPETTQSQEGEMVECPGADYTSYISRVPIEDDGHSGTSMVTATYLRICDHNFNFNDIHNVTTNTAEDCMDLCTQWNWRVGVLDVKCAGVVWNYLDPQGTNYSYCWLKGMLENRSVTPQCQTGVLLP